MAFLPSERKIKSQKTALEDGDLTVNTIRKVFFEERDGAMVRVEQLLERSTKRIKLKPEPKKEPAKGRFRVPEPKSRPSKPIKNSRWVKKVLNSDSKADSNTVSQPKKSGTFASSLRSDRFRSRPSREEEYKYTVFMDNIPEYSRDELKELVVAECALRFRNINRVNVVQHTDECGRRKHGGKAFVVLDTVENCQHVISIMNGLARESQIIHAAQADKR